MLIKSIKNCARCGQNHENIEIEEFERPVYQYGNSLLIDSLAHTLLYNYWGVCPENKQPILVKVTA